MYKEGTVEKSLTDIFFFSPRRPPVQYFQHLSVFIIKSLPFPPLILTKWETSAELNLEHIVKEQILFRVWAQFDGVRVVM